MKRYLSVAAFLGVAGLVVALAEPAAEARDNSGWGTVKGQVVYGGDVIPARNAVDVNKDQQHCLSKGPILSEEWVVNKDNKGVRWAFVWLTPADKNGKLPIHPSLAKITDDKVEMDQPCCMFTPHCLGMRQGQKLVAKNSAPIAHNTHWTGHPLKNPGGNVIVPAKQSHTIEGLQADRFPIMISCDIHGWMKAWVRVFDHPYFAVTDENGKFEMKNAPAGTYQLVTWHEATGWGPGGRDGNPITIKAGGETDVGKIEIK